MHDTHLHQMSGQTSTTNETWGLWLIFLLHRAQDSNRISAKDLFLCENKPLDKAQHFLQVTGSVSRDPSAAQTRSFSDDGCDHGTAAVEKFNNIGDCKQALPCEEGRRHLYYSVPDPHLHQTNVFWNLCLYASNKERGQWEMHLSALQEPTQV